MKNANAVEQDLLIIRRNGSAELDNPKGGVWKIAYADFMTAMMAFFLVMWLINATSDTTKTGIANYFNPIKLSDGMDLPRKGLRDPELVEPGAGDPAGNDAPAQGTDKADRRPARTGAESEAARGKVAQYSEEGLFRDPYAVLAAIAAEAEAKSGLNGGGLESGGPEQMSGAAGELDRIGSEPYRDPFDPPARTLSASNSASRAPEPPWEGGAWLAQQGTGALVAKAGQTPRSGAGIVDEPAAIGPVPMTDGTMPGTGIAAGGGAAATDAALPDSPRLADRLLESLKVEAAARQMPNVTVTRGEDGVLISLADQVDFGMFAIGSAEPLPETIAVMAKIATVLKELPGKVIIRGHTDGRPFRTETYDNWRLSAARAHMAYHMLVHGGLDEGRVRRIEGHADRDLKLPGDPMAAENRRIEILVQEVSS